MNGHNATKNVAKIVTFQLTGVTLGVFLCNMFID